MIFERRAFRGWTVSALLLLSGAAASAISFEQVSVPALGGANDGLSFRTSISADGRFVAFTSRAGLVPGDPAVQESVYVRDRRAKTTELISVAANGGTDAGASRHPSISGDGRYVAFESTSSLVTGDNDFGGSDIFLRDRQAQTTVAVSGGEEPAISADGRYVAFQTGGDVWVKNLQTGTSLQIGDSGADPSISGNGRFVVLESFVDLAKDDPDKGRADIYLYDLATQPALKTRLSKPSGVGEDSGDSFDPFISADGQTVVFQSTSKLTPADTDSTRDLYVYDLAAGTIELLAVPAPSGVSFLGGTDPCLSGDGRIVAFTSFEPGVPEDTDNFLDLYVVDRTANAIHLIRRPPAGNNSGQGNIFPSLSADGRHLAFVSAGLGNSLGTGQVFAADLDLANPSPAVAADSEGNFLVVWEGVDLSGASAVFARAYGPHAQALFNDFQVNFDGPALEPAVAAIGPGSFAVVWTTKLNSSIRLRFVNLGPGVPILGLEVPVETAEDDDAGVGASAISSNGLGANRLAVAWESFDLPRGMARQDVEGVLYESGVLTPFVAAASVLPEAAPDVAMAADGSFAVAWTYGGAGIGALRFDGTAGAIEPAAVINRQTVGVQQAVALAPQLGGNYMAVWESRNPDTGFGIFGRRLPGAANPEAQMNSQVEGDQRAPDVSADTDGHLMVTWRDEETDSIKLQRLLASGAFIEEEAEIPATAGSTPPRVASLGGGRFAVVYSAGSGVAVFLAEPSDVYEECANGLCATSIVSMSSEGRLPLKRRHAVPREGVKP